MPRSDYARLLPAHNAGKTRHEPMMASISHLPTEIVEAIVLVCHSDDLASLALTCRLFHRLAQPRLYREISIYGFSGGPTQRFIGCKTTSIGLLTRTLRNVPAYASLVESLHILDPPKTRKGGIAGDVTLRNPEELLSALVKCCSSLRSLTLDGGIAVFDGGHFTREVAAELARTLKTLQLRLVDLREETLGEWLGQTPTLITLVYETSMTDPMNMHTLGAGLAHVRNTLQSLTLRHDLDELLPLWSYLYFDLSLQDFKALRVVDVPIVFLLGLRNHPGPLPLGTKLPPTLQRLMLTGDLAQFETYPWRDCDAMIVFRRFLCGEAEVSSWGTVHRGNLGVEWETVSDPDWKAATPCLEEFGFEIDEDLDIWEYWTRARREELRGMCEGQGLRHTIMESWKDCSA